MDGSRCQDSIRVETLLRSRDHEKNAPKDVISPGRLSRTKRATSHFRLSTPRRPEARRDRPAVCSPKTARAGWGGAWTCRVTGLLLRGTTGSSRSGTPTPNSGKYRRDRRRRVAPGLGTRPGRLLDLRFLSHSETLPRSCPVHPRRDAGTPCCTAGRTSAWQLRCP